MHHTPNTIEIIPGILEQNWDEIERKIQISQPFASILHIDIIDGIFVDNHTFMDPSPFLAYSKDFVLELHMMVENPLQYIEPFARAGFKRFLGHIEMMENQKEFISAAKQWGEAGLALDGPTTIEAITVPFSSVDSFLIYTSERVGFSGPKLLPERLEKVRLLREQTTAPIEVDGGITADTLPKAKEAGATRFATTSYIFSDSNPQERYTQLKSLI